MTSFWTCDSKPALIHASSSVVVVVVVVVATAFGSADCRGARCERRCACGAKPCTAPRRNVSAAISLMMLLLMMMCRR